VSIKQPKLYKPIGPVPGGKPVRIVMVDVGLVRAPRQRLLQQPPCPFWHSGLTLQTES